MKTPASRWAPAGVVAIGAAVATAHGLYEVAAAAEVPTLIAWLYPLITDGLALVAYAATAKLTGPAVRYAWAVVVLAAGLSGLAQAAYLASGDLQADSAVRFGVGAWPALAAALVAHLLHLLAVADDTRTPVPASDPVPVQVPEPLPQVAHDEPKAKAGADEPHEFAVEEPAAPTPEQDPEPPALAVDPAPAVDEPSDVDPRVVELARRLAAGEDLTGPAIGAELEVSDRTGRRLLADARAHLDEHRHALADLPSAARPDLHLITRTTAGGTA